MTKKNFLRYGVIRGLPYWRMAVGVFKKIQLGTYDSQASIVVSRAQQEVRAWPNLI